MAEGSPTTTIDLTPGTSLPEATPALARGSAFQFTVLDIFEATVLGWGERTAIAAPDVVLDYLELAQAAEALADRLRRGGVGR